MKPIEYIIIAVAGALVLFTVIYNIIRYKRRKGRPCSGCSDCNTCAKYGCGCYGVTPADSDNNLEDTDSDNKEDTDSDNKEDFLG